MYSIIMFINYVVAFGTHVQALGVVCVVVHLPIGG